MDKYKFIDKKGSFSLDNPELISYLYFPVANEAGVMSSVTPSLNGDSKMGQNTFILEPVSSENLHNNKSSRNFWVYEEGKGAWSATGVSAAQMSKIFSADKEETRVTAGLLWHKTERASKEAGLSSEIVSYVPVTEDKLELMKVTIKNISGETKVLTPTAAVPMYARSADNIRDHRHVTSLLHRTKTEKYGVVINPTLTFDERGQRLNEVLYGVLGAEADGSAPAGFFPVVEDYIGEGGSFEMPEAVIKNRRDAVKEGYREDGFETVGALRFEDVTLAPGESASYIVALVYGGSEADIEDTFAKYASEKAFDAGLEANKAYWDEKMNVAYETGDGNFDMWMRWVSFQPMLRRIYGCSFLPHHDYGKGGRGWRDLWQDCLALLIMNPEGVRGMLFDNFGGVRIDGSNATIIGTKQGEFIADRNNITRVWMDHGAWPYLTTELYINQSGDLEFLLEETTYFKDLQAARGEKKDWEWNAEQGSLLKTTSGEIYKGSVLEHLLLQHLTAFYDVGEHNHIRLRGADWNDALDMAKDRGESVAFTALYAGNLESMAELILKLKSKTGVSSVKLAKEMLMLISEDASIYDDIAAKQKLVNDYSDICLHTVSGEKAEVDIEALAANLKAKAEWIKKHIRDTEWVSDGKDNSWFNGYYDNSGRQVEGYVNDGVRMMLTGQVFTVMTGVALDEQVASIAKASDKYLYDAGIGGYRLNTDFHEVKTDLGRMFGFAYGTKENGAVFCHMATMYANALYKRGFVKEGFKAINTLYKHCDNTPVSRIYPGVPEYVNGRGRGLYHYLTGAASWMLLTVITEMFGVKGDIGDLKFEPKLVREQFDSDNKAALSLVYAGKALKIVYYNKSGKEFTDYRVVSVKIDGSAYDTVENKISRAVIEALSENNEHIIEVVLD